MASIALQDAARRAGLRPVALTPSRRPGRPQGAQDRQKRVVLSRSERLELLAACMRERYTGVTMGEQERRVASFENRELKSKVLQNEEMRHAQAMRYAELRRYRKGPKPAPMLVRRKKA